MATSTDHENPGNEPSEAHQAPPKKPRSSPVRAIVLLLLLAATVVVFGLEFFWPMDESETKLVSPTKTPPARNSAQPQSRQQPAAPGQPAPTPQQPKTSPAPAPAPPQYERPPATILVSSSPSDLPQQTQPVAAATATEPGPAPPSAATPPPSEAAPDATVAFKTGAPTVAAANPAPETEPAATPEVSPDLVASRSPVSAIDHGQQESGVAAVVDRETSAPEIVPRPLPKGPVPVKVTRYAEQMMQRHDTNGDGVIDAAEQRGMQGDPSGIDYNADGSISLEELAAYTADFGRHRRMRLTGSMVEDAVAELPPLYIPTAERDAQAAALAAAAQKASQPAQAIPVALAEKSSQPDAVPTGDSAGEEEGDQPAETEDTEPAQPASPQSSSKRFVTPKSRLAGLPQWFLTGDANGDGQLTVAEYAPNSEKARLATFARYDRNHDGVLTPQECPKN